ncbi:hypothetical protein L3Q82_015790, partial [Scortum barcoo]
LSKPILTQLPCMAVFSPGPWHTNQANAARTTGSQSRGEANNSLPRMGLSHWAGRVATVPGLKLVHRGLMYERAHAIPPALMIPSERANCVCTPDPAGFSKSHESVVMLQSHLLIALALLQSVERSHGKNSDPLSPHDITSESVEICDRDWECFFAECEECNLLPPSLAGVDDSGMSDIDETGSILAKRVQNVDLTVGFSEANCPIDGPPDCEGSPVEHYLSKHGVGGIESVLSGSEEDIHLQSVNIFFEGLKNVIEDKEVTEPSQVRAGKNRQAIQEEGRCSDGQQASSSTLPENIPKLNSVTARGETAVGNETTEPVDTISNINKMKKDKPDSNIFPEPAGSNLVLKTNKSVHLETKLFFREEACTETRVNEAMQSNQSHDSADRVICSESTPHADKMITQAEMYTPLDDVRQEALLTSPFTLSKKCSTDSWSNLENVLQSDITTTNKTASQESSPSASIRRKRRKKRRLSVEPADSVHSYERQVLVKQSDSEEEQCASKGGMGLCGFEDIKQFDLNEPRKNIISSLTTYSNTSNVPVNLLSVREMKVNDIAHYSHPCDCKYHYLPERCKATGPADNSVISMPCCSINVATKLQPCNKLQVEESSGLKRYPGLPVLITDCVTGQSDLATETANCERKDTHAGSPQQSDKKNNFVICLENEQNPALCIAEVKSGTLSILPSTESNDPTVEVSQKDKLSAAKSVLAVEAGNSGRDDDILCQREADSQPQLEIDCHSTDQYNSTLGNTHFPLSATGVSSSDAHNTEPMQCKTTAFQFSKEIPSQVDCADLILDMSNSLPDKYCLSKTPTNLEKNITVLQTDLAASQISAFYSGNPFQSDQMSLTHKSQSENDSSTSEALTSPPDITPASSCYTLDTESVMSLSNENITDMSGQSSLSVSQNDFGSQGEKTSVVLAKHETGVGISETKSQSVLNNRTDLKCDLVVESEDPVTASKTDHEPEKIPASKHSVFAMSSFWSEMEKLTINDILGLRMINSAAPPSSLPPLQESEETDILAMTDSETKPEPTNENPSSNFNAVESSSGSVDSPSFRGVLWENEPVPVSLGADIYPENMMLTSVRNISQPVVPVSAQMCLRKISKNVSVHNLHALDSESYSYTWKDQTLQTLDEGEVEKGKHFTDGPIPKQNKDVDCLAPSSTDSYRISLTDIYQYLFGRKQSVPSQSATDNITTYYTDGNSVPETYDHFFSEFDTESFFYPVFRAEDEVKDEMVPIFSCSCSANKKLQFPEAYDYFFASSSSDDSSVESDEEDNCSPVRVVTRFSRTSSTSKISGDTYENFFTDSDLRQNFFWKTTLSFRKMSFTGSAAQKQTLSQPLSVVPVRQSGKSFRRTISKNVLGNPDVMFPDPLLYHLEDRISRQLVQQPFRYEDLQTAVSNPRLDTSLLPLKQSDMCLVCIAFASWVLKTANPQVGDAWKAGMFLLANVSALSAIRYLRKYVKMEAAANEKKLCNTAPSDS